MWQNGVVVAGIICHQILEKVLAFAEKDFWACITRISEPKLNLMRADRSRL
jgi:hypothetical protein